MYYTANKCDHLVYEPCMFYFLICFKNPSVKRKNRLHTAEFLSKFRNQNNHLLLCFKNPWILIEIPNNFWTKFGKFGHGDSASIISISTLFFQFLGKVISNNQSYISQVLKKTNFVSFCFGQIGLWGQYYIKSSVILLKYHSIEGGFFDIFMAKQMQN